MVKIEKQSDLIARLVQGKPSEFMVRGMCRVWTGAALDEIGAWAEENGVRVVAEAREVRLWSGIEHTFVRVEVAEWEPILFDGTGVEGFPPFFGLEKAAPEHLRNSRVDTWIMKDRAGRDRQN